MIQGHRSPHETLRPCDPGSAAGGGSPFNFGELGLIITTTAGKRFNKTEAPTNSPTSAKYQHPR